MIIGHQKQWDFLKRSLEANKLSHAYLFCGQEKLGKKTFALEFVKLINGDTALGKSHPDLILVEPEGQVIQISQIKELNRKLSLKPYSAHFKIAIIDRAHCLNREAQNCFLKTLEEPKGRIVLILITEMPEFLLPAILSRVQKIKFFPIKKDEIRIYLKRQGIKEKEVDEISEFSSGKPGLAIDFISDFEKLKNKRKIIKELLVLSNANLSFRFQYVKKISEKEDIGGILDTWLRYFRQTDLYKYRNIIKRIQNINFLLSTTNINSKLALEMLMLEL